MIFLLTFLVIFLFSWLIATVFGLTGSVSKSIFPVKLAFYMFLVFTSLISTLALFNEIEKIIDIEEQVK